MTPFSRVLLLIVAELVKKLHAHYGTRQFTTVRCLQGHATERIASQMNLIATIAPYSLKIRFNIILPLFALSNKFSLPFNFSEQYFECISLFHVLVMCLAHLSTLKFCPNNIWLNIGVHIMKLLDIQFSPPSCYVSMFPSIP